MARQFHLREPILGIVPVTHVVRCIPPGAMVEIRQTISEDNRMIEGYWENKPILLFFDDLQNRGDEIAMRHPPIAAHLTGRSFQLKVPLYGIHWPQDLPTEVVIPARETVSVLEQHASGSRVISVEWRDLTLLLFTEDLQQQIDIGCAGAAEV